MMALGIPAIAWVENSALFFVLVAGRLDWNCRRVLAAFA
jgi:hypothetical protein